MRINRDRYLNELIIRMNNNMIKVVTGIRRCGNQDFNYQKEELSNALLVDYETALTLFRFESSKRILKEANDFLVKS